MGMTAEAVHSEAMKIQYKNIAGLNSVSQSSFSSLGKSFFLFLHNILLI